MVSTYKVGLTPSLRDAAEQWSAKDQAVLWGFMMALADNGFDVIGQAFTSRASGIDVEFIEPGETPEMVWARVYLPFGRTRAVRVVQRDTHIILDEG